MPTAVADHPAAIVSLPSTADLGRLSDAELQQRQRDFAAARRQVDAGSALVAAEVARRSSVEFGYAGLAQREGARSAEHLLERIAGVTASEARALVRVGGLLETGSPLAGAVTAGEVSVAAADAIVAGLGEPTESVPASTLADATQLLIAVAPDLSVRRLASEARALRDSLDAAGVAEREALLRERRYLRLSPQPDGMTRLTGLLDPESAALVTSAFDQVTSPRRGGPRFVDPADQARARAVVDDPRTTEQLLVDAFVELVRIAGAADPGRVFGQHRPAVTVHVERADFEAGQGVAHLEGQTSAVSVATARRLACAEGAVPVLFDEGRVLDVGRTQRLFTERQRIALAARDGGCRWDDDCDRPPSWCEAHHIDEWARHGGSTDVAAGILLCRFHHLMVHNLGWRIEARGPDFAAIPPPGSGRAERMLPEVRLRR